MPLLETDMVTAELVEATQSGSWQEVERILKEQSTAAADSTAAVAAFDVNQYLSDIGGTLLHEAARYGHARIAGILIKHGASVYIMDEFGETPFHSK
jgi:ankyrin repeat protein